jgi:uncharacterized membrane protein
VSLLYNRIAGRNLDRLAALSDGIFAVSMTLLVLDLHVPELASGAGEADLWSALVNMVAPRILPYLMSFLTLGIFWVGQQTQLNYFERSDRTLTWIHLGFLLAVTLTPFSTGLLASFITNKVAIIVYWLNILLLGVMLFASWRYAYHAKLIKEDTPPEVRAANERRIIVAQSLYAFGMLLCFINPYLSVGFIFLVQLNYVLALGFGPLNRVFGT